MDIVSAACLACSNITNDFNKVMVVANCGVVINDRLTKGHIYKIPAIVDEKEIAFLEHKYNLQGFNASKTVFSLIVYIQHIIERMDETGEQIGKIIEEREVKS